MTTRTMTLPKLGALAATVALMSACSSGMGGEGSTEEGGQASDGGGEMAMDPAADLVGPGCADYAEMVPDGAGSVEGMAQDPLSVAASNNPMLTKLTSAVSGELNADVDLTGTLDGDEFTVFAPVDDAFAEIPEEDLGALAEDSEALTDVLTYHVVPGQIGPDEIAGTHTTVQGEDVEVTGEGDDLKVGDAAVICGGVQTQNATVYLVDTVLMPPAMADAA
ncbi:fasciclin domain-containing protein [Brachybacterium sacelli]|uniref:Surface protein with fasciclin (FAS1) repeats n=1 Tax=Brachybacterium sacelli TaxID=173364 RepID=A0ABS4WX97_9MICO|nr:fasciclin domain-containing protein [Brachybacterium sacelli]MBP2380824.1 putative surface protein with fasciclin (FAS1) repeats [Brachybacterium sacelli]